MDSRGLVVNSRTDLPEWKAAFAQDRAHTFETEAVIDDFAPTAIIGASGVGARFNEVMLSAMARINDRPIVFALSNPTSKAECTAEQAFAWTQGRVVFASGSPFPPVTHDGRIYSPAQGNNFYVFPGVGLGLLLAGATQVSDEMFLAAAHALADCVSAADLEQGRLFPPASSMRDVAVAVAAAVASVAHEQGSATCPPVEDFLAAAASFMYEPRYS